MKTSLMPLAAVMVFACLPFAQAQALSEDDAEEPDADRQLDVVVVTAQKRAQDINDVGLTMQAVGGEGLKDAGVQTTSDLTQVVSGFNYAKSSANTPIYTLRGIGFQTPNLSSTSPVGIYVDEIAYVYPYFASGPTFDLERVEVLKGPQGTLYGRNTTGGLVNFITAKPTDTFQAGASVEIGNYETFNAEGFVSGPVSDNLRLRLAVRQETSGQGWQESVSRPGDRLGEKDRSAARLSLDWTPTDRLQVLLGASWWQDQSDTVAPQANALDVARPATAIPGLTDVVRSNYQNDEADWDAREPGKPPFEMDSRFYSLTGRVNYDLSDSLSFVSLTGYNNVRRRDFNDLDGTQFELLAYGSNGKIESFSQEFRLVGKTDALEYLLGVFYAEDKVSDDQVGYYDENSTVRLLRIVGAGVPQIQYTPEEIAGGFANFQNSTDQDNQSASILANAEWSVSDRWTLVGGLRYTKDEISFEGCSRDFNGNTIPVWNTAVAALTGSNTNVQPNECLTYSADFSENILAQRSLDEDNVAGRIGVNFEPNETTLLYASIARGFKSGAFPVLPANVETQFAAAVQEQVTAYETGIKAGLFNQRAQANVSAFYYDYKDKQIYGDVQDPIFTTLPRIVNVPESRVWGVETEFVFDPTDDLRLQTGISYVDTEVTEFVGINRLGQVDDFAGLEFPNSPKWHVNGQVQYERPLTDLLGVNAVLSASYQSEAQGAIGNEADFRISEYTLVNGVLGLRTLDETWSVELFARNLLDEDYWTNVDTVIDTIFQVPGQPRTFGVRLSYQY